ncbi:hypothetical protein ACMXYX_11210 [Neptuniibacter sp. QD72_48]|uniref:hypothetical protein n=1 Tax=unclassified Neptuniibacter TaxID=2630693 RepID=UPI0039F46ACA
MIINGYLFGISHRNKHLVLLKLMDSLAEQGYAMKSFKLDGDYLAVEVIDLKNDRKEHVVEIINQPQQPEEIMLFIHDVQQAA